MFDELQALPQLQRLEALLEQVSELESGKPYDPEADTFAELMESVTSMQSLWAALSERVTKRAGTEGLTTAESAELDMAVRSCEHKLRLAITAASRKVRVVCINGLV